MSEEGTAQASLSEQDKKGQGSPEGPGLHTRGPALKTSNKARHEASPETRTKKRVLDMRLHFSSEIGGLYWSCHA